MRIPRASIVGVGIGLGIALIAGGAFFLGSATVPKQANAAAGHSEKTMPSPGPTYAWKERVVNLADPGNRRYLKLAISIEFADTDVGLKKASAEERKYKQDEFEKHLAPQVPMIDDAIITLLSGRTSADVASQEGKARLKHEIKESLNRLLGGEHVVNLYFTQFVTQ